MNEKLITAFDACLSSLESGASLEKCLEEYPEFEADLRPMLETALQTLSTMQSIEVPAGTQKISRSRFLAQAAKLSGESRSSGARPNAPANLFLALSHIRSFFQAAFSHAWMAAVALILLIILASTGIIQASAQSLPGSPLYGLKRTIEQTQINLSPDAESRARLEEKFSEQRTQETHQIVKNGWNVSLEFGGLLEVMNGENWQVAGVTVIVPTGTRIEGSPQIGLYVRVQGTTQSNGQVQAHQIWVEGERFQGRVENIQAGEWQVDGRQILISDDTQIDDNLELGDLVEVNVMILPSGGRIAERIRLVASGPQDENHEPTQTAPEATSDDHDANSGKDATSTLVPTSSSLTETRTPSPTNTSGSNDSGKTQEPTKTPEPTRTPDPSQTSGPSNPGDPTPTPSTPQEVRFQGVVQSINGNTWVVAGQTIQVDGNTQIDSNLQPGDLVEVRAILQTDGALTVLRIQKKN